MSTAYTIPNVNGDGSQFALTLNWPSGPTGANLLGGVITWAISATTGTAGTVVGSNDGYSALYTVATGVTGSNVDTVTATMHQGATGQVGTWQPGRLYRLGDQIEANGYLQTVSSAARLIPTIYTPLHNSIPSFGWSGAAPSAFAGDAGWFAARSTEFTSVTGLALFAIDPNGLNVILNQGDGDFNGDWPVGAVQVGPDTNQQGSKTGYYLNSAGVVTAGLNPGPVTAASVTVVAAGYSSGANYIAYPGANEAGTSVGIESPVPTVLALTSVAASSGGVAVYTGTIAANATAAAALVGSLFVVQGFISSVLSGSTFVAVNNGAFICTAATTTTLTLANAIAVAETHTASTYVLVPTDSRMKNASYEEKGAGAKGTFAITSVVSTVAGSGVAVYVGTFSATVNALIGYTFKVAGFVTHPTNNGVFLCTASTSTNLTLANAAAVGESATATAVNSGTRAYLDAQGNAHIGWQLSGGTQDFSTPVANPPAFKISGYTLDNELIWLAGAAASTATKAAVLTTAVGAATPLGYFGVVS